MSGEEGTLTGKGCQLYVVFLMSSLSTGRVFPYPNAAGILWKVAEYNLGIFIQEEEDTFCHGQKTSHANYSRLAILILTWPQCVAKQEILNVGFFFSWLVFITAQPQTTVSCNSLLKHHTLQLLATISQS